MPLRGSTVHSAETAVAATCVFVLTQGPVLNAWPRLSSSWDEPFVSGATVWTYALVGLVAVFLVGRSWPGWRHLGAALPWLAAMVVWVIISTAWSTGRSFTWAAGLGIGTSLAVALWLRLRLSLLRQLTAVFAGTLAGVVLSAWSIVRTWPLAENERGETVGIYVNRNSLGPVAAICLLAGLWLVGSIVGRGERTPASIPAMAGCAVGVLLAAWTLLESGSLTSTLCTVVAGGVGVAILLATRVDALHRRLSWVLAGTYVALLAAFAAIGPLISSWSGRGSDFTSRGTIWRTAWDGFLERPVVGWGFGAAWYNPDFRVPLQVDEGMAARVYEAHNGYLELLLGTGPLGLILATVGIGLGAVALARALQADRLESWWVVALTYCLVANLLETFIRPNHFLMVLLFAACLAGARRTASSVER